MATTETILPSSDPSAGARSLIVESLAEHRRDLIVGGLLVGVHQGCETLVPVVVGLVIDRAIEPGSVSGLTRWVAVVVALFVVLALSAMVGYFRVERAAESIAHDLRLRVTDRAIDPRGEAAAVDELGETVSLATSDASRVGLAAEVVGLGFGALVALVGGALLLLAMSWQLGLVVLVGLPIVVVLVQRLSAPLEARSDAEQASVAAAAGVATDLIYGLRVLKGLGAEVAATARYRAASRAALDGRMHAARFLGAYETVTLAIATCFLVLVAWVGGRLAVEGTISVGELVAAVGLAQFLVGPLSRLATIGATAARARASAARLASYLSAPHAVEDPEAEDRDLSRSATPGDGPTDLALTSVRLGPLDAVDLSIESGEWVGIAAEGAEALALMDLLARRADPDVGSLHLGANRFDGLALDHLRRLIVIADHDAVLFSGTLNLNLNVSVDGTPIGSAGSADHAAARSSDHHTATLRATTVDEVMSGLPEGGETSIGENGSRLSGGQRQRVLLARAVATDAAVLVLHDPTTAVDAATDVQIATRLRSLRKDRTTIVITTNPTWLAVCDRVIVIDGGTVRVDGTHQQLIARDVAYRELVSR